MNIRKVIEETVNATVESMRRNGMIRDPEKRSTDKVEDLLRAYPTFRTIGKDEHAKNICTEVEKALAMIKSDQYYDVIELYYFQDIPVDVIAGQIGCSISTAFRNKKRLIGKLAVYLFADDVIREITE